MAPGATVPTTVEVATGVTTVACTTVWVEAVTAGPGGGLPRISVPLRG